MVKELNEKTIAEAAKHLNNIQEGKTPILFKKDEGLIGEEYVEEKVVKNKDGKRIRERGQGEAKPREGALWN